jgi:hypothetical protein
MPTAVRESYKLKANSNKSFKGIYSFTSKAPNVMPSCVSLEMKVPRKAKFCSDLFFQRLDK